VQTQTTQTQTQTEKVPAKEQGQQYAQPQTMEMPVKDELQRQISEQVYANAIAFDTPGPRTSGVTPPDVVKFMQAQRPPDYMDDEHNQGRRRGYPFMTLVGVLSVIGLLAGVFWTGKGSSSSSISSPVSKDPPCFEDNFNDPNIDGTNAEPSITCDASLPAVACPDHAVCIDGSIRSCLGSYFEISEEGRECVLSSAANLTLAKVEGALATWSVEHTCTLQGCEYAIKGEGSGPLFTMEKVQEEVEGVNEELLSLSDAFVLVDEPEAGEVLVGLSDEYMDNRLDISWLCFMVLFLSALVSGILSLLWSIATQGFGALFNVTAAYPILSFVCFIIVLIMRHRRRRKQEYEQLIQDAATVRGMVYDELMADCLEHAALHLRDSISYSLHPTSLDGRHHFVRKVWPKVVADIRMDNRVGKSDKMINGRPRDVWQWLAGPPTNRRSTVQFLDKKDQ